MYKLVISLESSWSLRIETVEMERTRSRLGDVNVPKLRSHPRL